MKAENKTDRFMEEAIGQAKKSLAEGGIPIGSVLVRNNEIIGKWHNQRIQKSNPILHGEMDCLQNAGRQKTYKDTVLYSTLMPCYMCAGTIIQFKIPHIIVGENKTYGGAYDFLISHGVKVDIVDSAECIEIMENFIRTRPELWNEDISE